jgi:hypothetical protein
MRSRYPGEYVASGMLFPLLERGALMTDKEKFRIMAATEECPEDCDCEQCMQDRAEYEYEGRREAYE